MPHIATITHVRAPLPVLKFVGTLWHYDTNVPNPSLTIILPIAASVKRVKTKKLRLQIKMIKGLRRFPPHNLFLSFVLYIRALSVRSLLFNIYIHMHDAVSVYTLLLCINSNKFSGTSLTHRVCARQSEK